MKHRAGFVGGSVLAAALTLGTAAPALASNSGSGGAGAGSDSGQQQAPISDEKLSQFAAAYGEIRSVRAEYVPKLQQAEGEEEQSRLRQEGQQEMVEAIQANGLDVSEYQRIGRRLNNDQQLQERLKSIMREQQGTGQPGSGQGQGSSQ